MRRMVVLLGVLFACNTDTFTDDGGADAPTDNVVGGGDGSVDAPGKDVVAKPSRFCETVDAQFCADFDIPNDAGAGFAPPLVQNGWVLSFAPNKGADASTGVQIVNAADASGSAYIDNALLAQSVNLGPKTKLVVEADVFLVNTATVPDPIMVFSAGSAPNPQMTFGLAAHSNAWRLARRAGGVVLLNPQPPTNEWLHATLTIDLDPNVGMVTLLVGSSVAQMTAVPTEADGGVNPGFLRVGAEDQYYPSASVSYLVDNVIARWQ